MEKNYFYVKKFDEKYSQSREAQLIQYLNQRGAQVPKLISSHPNENILKLENVGDSLLNVLEKNKITQKLNSIEILKILRSSIVVCQEISKYDIWHFDLALRNFTLRESKELDSKSVFLIDFSAAISSSFPLQKPLWLRPDTKCHHNELVSALENDWSTFFQKNSLSTPEIVNNEFTIPIQKYNNYWNSFLSVQEIKNPICVISHSLGIMIHDSLHYFPQLLRDVNEKKMIELKKSSINLKDLCSSEKAYIGIIKLKESLDFLIFELQNSSGITPRPKFAYKKEDVKALNSTFITDKKLSQNIILTKKNFLALYFLLSGFFIVDVAFSHHKVILTNYLYYISLIAIGLLCVCIPLLIIKEIYKFVYKSFLRIESIILFFYFWELFLNNAEWFFLIYIFFASIATILLSFNTKIKSY